MLLAGEHAVKALPKKRRHQMAQDFTVHMLKASILKYQAIWYVSFIAVYVWFMYWVACDFFVWHKPVSEVNPVNYAGAIAAIAFIWVGAKLLKPERTKAASSQQKLLPPQHPQPTPQLLQKPAPQPKQKPMPQNQPPQKTAPATAPANSACTHYLGYLNQREKSQEIPAECFTCEHIINCMGSLG